MTGIVYRWPGITKDPDDTRPVQLSVFALCAQFWTPNEQYALGDFVWPRIIVLDGQIVKGALGVVLECTQAGRSGTKEPRWSTVPDTAMSTADGTVIWTPRIGALQGISPVTNPLVVSDTQDLTVSSVVVNEGTKMLLDYSGGTLGQAYEVELSFMIGGRTRTGRQIVTIAKE